MLLVVWTAAVPRQFPAWLALFWAASKQQEAIGLCQLGGERDKQESEMMKSSRKRPRREERP